jgi:hypothetical protein
MKAPRALLAVLLLASVASFLIAAEAAAPSGVLTPEEVRHRRTSGLGMAAAEPARLNFFRCR